MNQNPIQLRLNLSRDHSEGISALGACTGADV
jgi:hypothetical protein